MAHPTYDVLHATFSRMLPNLKAVLGKAEVDAEARKIDPQVFLQARLAPDMLTLTRQVQIATDGVKGSLSRLAGIDVPKWADDEGSFAEIQERVDRALAYLGEFEAAQFDGAEDRTIELTFPNGSFSFTGKSYVLDFVLPNFYFHVTTAYAILRHNGVKIGKRDFLGA